MDAAAPTLHPADADRLRVVERHPPAIGYLWLEQGGYYAGPCRGRDGAPDYHLVLCPADSAGLLDWSRAKVWAHQLRVDGFSDWALPTPAELDLLHAQLPDLLPPSLLWTSAVRGLLSGSVAVAKDLATGLRMTVDTTADDLRACAVRRVQASALRMVEVVR